MLSGDAASGGYPAPCRGADVQEGWDVGAAQGLFGLDVGAEELSAKRLQRPHRFDGGHGERRLPAVNHDLAAAAVDGGDHAVCADRVSKFLRELEIWLAVLEECRAGNHLVGAGRENFPGACGRSNTAADPAREARRNLTD